MNWILVAAHLALVASIVIALWASYRWMEQSQERQCVAIANMEAATKAIRALICDSYRNWEHDNPAQLQVSALNGFMMPSRYAPVALAQEVVARLPEGWVLYLAEGAEQYRGCHGWPHQAENIEVVVGRRAIGETRR